MLLSTIRFKKGILLDFRCASCFSARPYVRWPKLAVALHQVFLGLGGVCSTTAFKREPAAADPLMTAFVQKTITDTNGELEFTRGVVTENCWTVGFLDRMREEAA